MANINIGSWILPAVTKFAVCLTMSPQEKAKANLEYLVWACGIMFGITNVAYSTLCDINQQPRGYLKAYVHIVMALYFGALLAPWAFQENEIVNPLFACPVDFSEFTITVSVCATALQIGALLLAALRRAL